MVMEAQWPVLGRLPVVDVEFVFDDPRRKAEREAFDASLCFVNAKGQWHWLDILLVVGGESAGKAPATIIDCSTMGLSLISDLELREGDDILVLATDAFVRQRLFVESFEVRRQQLSENRASVARSSMAEAGSSGRYQYGLMHKGSRVSRVFKCYLESLFLDYLRASNDSDMEYAVQEVAALQQSHMAVA